MANKFLTSAALTAALLAATACTANITTTTPTTGGGGGETAKAAVQVGETAPEVRQLDLGDLVPYRCENPEPNQANKVWVIFYYSAKTNKSYRCVTRIGQKVEFTEVTSEQDRYTPGDLIDEAKWKVDSEQAKTVAVQALQVVNVTLNIKSLTLISAQEFTRRTGVPSQDPVWVCAVDAPAASPSPSVSPSASPTATPTASPSADPTVSPSPSPTATATPAGGTTVINNITNVYVNANNGNKIDVNTGTQTSTTTTQTGTGNTATTDTTAQTNTGTTTTP